MKIIVLPIIISNIVYSVIMNKKFDSLEFRMRVYLSIITVLIFLIGCNSSTSSKIVTIPEASGIDYCFSSDTLVVANDEGWYYEIRTDGEIVYQAYLGEYDLEGVVCEENNFIFAVEDQGLLYVDKKTKKSQMILINTKYKNKILKIFDKKEGIEGITKINDNFYLAKQSKKRKESYLVVVKVTKGKGKIVDVIHHKIKDTAGLAYNKGLLYMVSDKKDKLIVYDVKKKQTLKKIGLEEYAQEGIAFDSNGFIYIADDEGAVWKYSEKDMGI